MTRRIIMENVMKDLTKIGIGFEMCQFKTKNRYNRGGNDFICRGILKDFGGAILTNEQLKSVLALAKKKDIYLVIQLGAKEIEKFDYVKIKTIPLEEHEIIVSFIQEGMFETFKKAYAITDAALKQNFLHYQEDEAMLKLEAMLERVVNQLEIFSARAYDLDSLIENSTFLRKVLEVDGAVFTCKEKERINVHMNDSDIRRDVEAMCYVGVCLRIIC